MTIRFSSLWFCWIGWTIGDVLWSSAGVSSLDLKTDFAIAFFIGAIQVYERFKLKHTQPIG